MPREDYTKTINAIKEALATISRQQADLRYQMTEITNVIHHIAPYTPIVSATPTLDISTIPALAQQIKEVESSIESYKTNLKINEARFKAVEDTALVMKKRINCLELYNATHAISNQDDILKQEQKATLALEQRIENLEIYAAGHPHIKYSAFEPSMPKVYITSIIYDKIIDTLNLHGFTSSRLGMTLIPKDRTQQN